MNYTKGEWKANLAIINGHLGIPIEAENRDVGCVYLNLFTTDVDNRIDNLTLPENQEVVANAHLMAASKDTYEALKEIIEATLFTDTLTPEFWTQWRIKAVKALNKAEG